MDYTYLRPAKRDCAKILAESFANRSNTLGIRCISNVTLRKLGQLMDPEPSDSLLADDCDFCSEIIGTDMPPLTHIAGKCLYAGFIRKSWGHFLMNSTARLWPLYTDNADNRYDHIVFFCEGDSDKMPEGNFKEFLRLAGILPKCIVLPETCHFDNLYVPELSLKLESHWSEEFFLPFIKVRESALEETPSIPHSKGVILTRSRWNAKNHMQINVESIEDLFASNGYRCVAPEQLTLSQLIVAMEGADEIVSFSGSTAHNFLFSGKKRLVTLERCAANNMYQTAINLNSEFRSTPVDCFWQPMPVLSTDNLTIYGFTRELQKFAIDRGFSVLPGDNSTELAPIKEFRQFLKIYRRHYGYGYPLHSYESAQFPAIAEACLESRPRYARYLDRRIPIQWADFLSPRVWVRYLRDLIHHRKTW